MNPAADRPTVRVTRSGFQFTCPGCGQDIGENDQVWSLPLIAGLCGLWPVCADCGRHWVYQHVEGGGDGLIEWVAPQS